MAWLWRLFFLAKRDRISRQKMILQSYLILPLELSFQLVAFFGMNWRQVFAVAYQLCISYCHCALMGLMTILKLKWRIAVSHKNFSGAKRVVQEHRKGTKSVSYSVDGLHRRETSRYFWSGNAANELYIQF